MRALLGIIWRRQGLRAEGSRVAAMLVAMLLSLSVLPGSAMAQPSNDVREAVRDEPVQAEARSVLSQFGRFVQHQSRARRVLKIVVVSGFYVWLAQQFGRPWAYGFLGIGLVAAAVVHLWWLPKHGINWWTAEPYDKYLALVTRRPNRP